MIFECKDVTLGYENKVVAKNLNFKIDQGDYLCVVGENGTGKSTLIKTLLGLIKPLNGEVIANVQGKNHKGVGYLPQQTQAQKDFPASVYEVVISGRLNNLGFRPFYTRKDKEDAIQKMKLMGIYDIKDKCYHDLSGGQQQRVLLARAMCATKKVILLDEPVAGLDPVVTAELYELIASINKNMGITVIMVSHDMEATLKYASHILYISDETAFFGTKEEYMKSKGFEKLTAAANRSEGGF